MYSDHAVQPHKADLHANEPCRFTVTAPGSVQDQEV